MGKNEA